MLLKELISKTGNWFRGGFGLYGRYDNGSLLIEQPLDNPVRSLSKVKVSAKNDSIEVLQDAFNQLVDRLGGINENLSRQIEQHEQLMKRVDELPQFLQNFPKALDNQKLALDDLAEQLRMSQYSQERFAEAVERIPQETARQTDAMVGVRNQIAAASDINMQMSESFAQFNGTLKTLQAGVLEQTSGVTEMSRTIAASDRFMRQQLARQYQRFIWFFAVMTGVSSATIITLILLLLLAK